MPLSSGPIKLEGELVKRKSKPHKKFNSMKESRFPLIFFSALALAMSIKSLFPDWLNYSASEALSLSANDGHCNPNSEGIGVHCFGDFFYPLQYANSNNPWGGDINPYPPISLIFFKPFALLRDVFPNTHVTLYLYLSLAIAGVVAAAFFLSRNLKLQKLQKAVLIVLLLTSGPILYAIDRGSNQIFLFPLMVMFVYTTLRGDIKTGFVCGILMTAIKPQMILLGLLFLVLRDFRILVKWLITNSLVFAFSFTFYSGPVLVNFKNYLNQLQAFQNYSQSPAGALSPPNLSLGNTVAILENLLNSWLGDNKTSNTQGYYSPWVTIIILLITIYILFKNPSKEIHLEHLMLVTILIITLPNVSYGYYSLLLVPIFLLYFLSIVTPENDRQIQSTQLSLKSKFTQRTWEIISLLLFIPWGIPWKIFTPFRDDQWSWVGINYVFVNFLLVNLFLSITFSLSRKHKYEKT